MIKAIERFLLSLQENTDHELSETDSRLASIALLVEVASIDQNFDKNEWQKIKTIAMSECQLSEDEADHLLQEAEKASVESVSLYDFTKVINRHLNDRQKQKLIKNLWHIAYVDGELNKHEEHTIRRVADLLHLRHSDFIKAKITVRNQTNK